MRIHKVQGILAVSANHVVGQKDMIPWHHSGDFKRFKSITMGHGILMGYPTFVGMAKNYTKPGQQVLPGRTIFVVGRQPFNALLDIDDSNVVMIETHGPKDDIETALKHLDENQVLFISGGARVYRDYLPYAEKVYFTLIATECPINEDTVMMNDFNPSAWRTITSNGVEIDSKGLEASYFILSATS